MPRRHHLTDYQKKKARDLFRDGHSRSSISRSLEVPVGIIYQITGGMSRAPKVKEPKVKEPRGLPPDQIDLLLRRYAQGETVPEIAPDLRRSASSLYKYLPKELRRPRGRRTAEATQSPGSLIKDARKEAARLRDEQINQLYLSGKSSGEIGLMFGLSTARVGQILKKFPRPVWVIAGAKKAQQRRRDELAREKAARAEDRCLSRYGVSLSVFQMIQVAHGGYIRPYLDKKHNAASRKSDWNLSLLDWVALWTASGKWSARGRGPGRFGLARIDTSKPYDKTNCFIGEFKQTCGPGRLRR